MTDQVGRYGVLDEAFDIGLEAPPIRPLAHISTVAEMRSEMVSTLRPRGEFTGAEAACRRDIVGSRLPGFHMTVKFGVMHELEVLS